MFKYVRVLIDVIYLILLIIGAVAIVCAMFTWPAMVAAAHGKAWLLMYVPFATVALFAVGLFIGRR